MKVPVSGLCCYTDGWGGKCSEILAMIKLLYNPRVNKVFIHTEHDPSSNSPLTVHLALCRVDVCFQFARLQVARSSPEKRPQGKQTNFKLDHSFPINLKTYTRIIPRQTCENISIVAQTYPTQAILLDKPSLKGLKKL